MSDGPFKHLKLGSRWKRFVAATCNDAFDRAERCAFAKDALLREILTEDNRGLLRDLGTYARQLQPDLDPSLTVGPIFLRHAKTAFADIFQRELEMYLSDGVGLCVGFREALAASVQEQIRISRSRHHGELIQALEREELTHEQYDRSARHMSASFELIVVSDVCDALRAGDRAAFKEDVAKKTGLDDGPTL